MVHDRRGRRAEGTARRRHRVREQRGLVTSVPHVGVRTQWWTSNSTSWSSRRDAPTIRFRSSSGSSRSANDLVPESGVRLRQQSRPGDDRRRVDSVLEPGYRGSRGHARAPRGCASRSARGRARGSATGDGGREPVPDDPSFPPRGSVGVRSTRVRTAARSCVLARGAGARPGRLRTGRRLRLDLRLVHARPVGRDPERRLSWTSGSFCTPRRRTSPSASRKRAGKSAMSPCSRSCTMRTRPGRNVRLDAQAAFAKRQYIEKHFSPVHRVLALGALVLGYGLRSVYWGLEPPGRASARAALATLVGRRPPPFGPPPSTALTRASLPTAPPE